MHFYVIIDGVSVGPLNQSDIQSKLEDGNVAQDALVWHEGLASWQPISEVFRVEVLNAPPPLPSLPKQLPPPISSPHHIDNHPQENTPQWFRRPIVKIGISLVAALLVLAAFQRPGRRNDVGTDFALRQIEELKAETRRLSEELHQARHKTDTLPQPNPALQPDSPPAGNAEQSVIANNSTPVSELPKSLGARANMKYLKANASATQRESAQPSPDKEPPKGDRPRLKMLGPKILGIQLGDNIESVCQRFNTEYASDMDGQRMEVRKLASDGTFACSTPDGLRAAEQLDKLNKPNRSGKPEDLLGGLLLGVMVGGEGVVQAKMAPAPIIYADKDGIISKYVIGSVAATNFFGRAALMSNREFASFLSAKYELPDLEGEIVETKDPFSNSTDYVPKYHGFSSDGFSVQIDEHKAIFIEKL